MKVKECMCSEVACVKPDSKITDVANLMLNKHIGCVPAPFVSLNAYFPNSYI